MVHDMRRFFIVIAVLASVSGCGGGGGGPSAPFAIAPVPTPSPTASPAGTLNVSKSGVAFTARGQSTTVDVSEAGYTGNVGYDTSSCGPIVSVTPASQQSLPATYTITANGAGSCSLAFVDGFGQRASVAIGVTLTQGVVK
ncbi:MAG: hypothetical protein QOF71_1717 [Candidatus Eremiobacteraeota bacterium]|jgi:hypothetical protein|nr:hypothetical protein [Candidatus Eremiobacteraeota bacterium]